ncbi:MAG: hypothetical protein C5B49_04580 [Bdellovibrio sp.]|nr:MAG: hypothetical protein C5B49_04580 [Bdellovibrio sp.]
MKPALLIPAAISSFLVCCLISCASLTSGDPEKAKLLLRLGTSQIEKGDYPLALKSLLESESLDPTNEITQNNLGLVYFFRERFDLAEEHMRRALKLKSDYTDAKNNLARILIEGGQPKEAIRLLKEVMNDLTYDRPGKATLNMGLAFFKLKKFAEARTYFIKTLQLGRDNCLAHNYLGRSYFETEDFRRASEALDVAVGFCKGLQFDEPHYYSALAYYELGDPVRAEARLEEVIKMYTNGRYSDQAKVLLQTIRK